MRELWFVLVAPALVIGFVAGLAIGIARNEYHQRLATHPSPTVELNLQHVDDLLHDAEVCIARTDEILIQLYSLKLQRKP